MRLLTRLTSLLILLLTCVATLTATPPQGDFSFTTRDGRVTTLYSEISRLQPDAQVWLLLFDPDCGDCKEMEERLQADPAISAGLADRSVAVFAIYPTDGIPDADDPNMAIYRQVCESLPDGWTVGTDNGSIFETDACSWETLPLLLKFNAGEIARPE